MERCNVGFRYARDIDALCGLVMECSIAIIISILGAGTLIGIFCRMRPGFGPFNLRALGIVFIGTLASLLALKDPSVLNAVIALLGAIVGYLFGIDKDKNTDKGNDSAN